MTYTNNIVTNPVDITSVSNLIGAGTNDLAALCKSDQLKAIFSACKPMDASTISGTDKYIWLTQQERAQCVWGLSPYTMTGVSFAEFNNNVVTLMGSSGTDVQHKQGLMAYDRKPTGTTVSPYRLSDFITNDQTSGYKKSLVADGKQETYAKHESVDVEFPYNQFPIANSFIDTIEQTGTLAPEGMTYDDCQLLLNNPPKVRLDIGSIMYWWMSYKGAQLNRYVVYWIGSEKKILKVPENGTLGTTESYANIADLVEGSTSVDVKTIEFYCDASTVANVTQGTHTFIFIPFSYQLSTMVLSHNVTRFVMWEPIMDQDAGYLETNFKLISKMNNVSTFGDMTNFEMCISTERIGTADDELLDNWAVVNSMPGLSDRIWVTNFDNSTKLYDIKANHPELSEFNNKNLRLAWITNDDFMTQYPVCYLYLHYKFRSNDPKMGDKHEVEKYLRFRFLGNE